MSARLVARLDGVHSFQDDLKLTIYVLLYMILMYSETSDRDWVPTFLSGILDPQPHGETGGFNKADFLKAWTFLQQVNFPGRPVLHHLINQLGDLFAVRYQDEPTPADETIADVIKKAMAANPESAKIIDAHKASFSYSYWTRMDALKDHQHTIQLFEVALQDSTSWPVNDIAVKQEFRTKTPLHHPVTKTGWDTTFFVVGLDKSDDIEMDEMSFSDTGGSE